MIPPLKKFKKTPFYLDALHIPYCTTTKTLKQNVKQKNHALEMVFKNLTRFNLCINRASYKIQKLHF